MELPPEIITSILYRLPVKSIGRFRSVSKNWLAQLTDPRFIKTHHKTLNPKSNHFICTTSPTHEPSFIYTLTLNQQPKKLTFHFPDPYAFTFYASCNGLVLASSDSVSGTRSLFVFNPTTMELVNLPHSGFYPPGFSGFQIMGGLGYDSLSDDYKVVIVCYHSRFNTTMQVYSLRYKFWSEPIDCPYYHSDTYYNGMFLSPVFVNGFLHWIAIKVSDHSPVIVAFSLADETFSEVSLGNGVDIMSQICRLFALGEKLGVFLDDRVWVMDEYGVRDSWSEVLIHGLYSIRFDEPKVFYEDGKIQLVIGSLMFVYDIEKKSFSESIDILTDIKGLTVKCSYVESLISPKFN